MRTRFVSKAIALVAGIAGITGLVASPAAAATPQRLTVDTDSVSVGSFTGTVSFIDDGSFVRGQLEGRLRQGGTVQVKWIPATGVPKTDTARNDQLNIVPVRSSRDLQTLVRAEVTYKPTYGASKKATFFVGDSPQSLGTCAQLDTDNADFDENRGGFDGEVRWHCEGGHPTAEVRGMWLRDSAGDTTSLLTVGFTFSDGSFEGVTIRHDGSTEQSIPAIAAPASPYSVRSVDVYATYPGPPVTRSHDAASVKFGDA